MIAVILVIVLCIITITVAITDAQNHYGVAAILLKCSAPSSSQF